MSDKILTAMANDAFDVLNWARRIGMKRDQQVQQLVEAFDKTLSDAKAEIHSSQPTGADVDLNRLWR